MACPVIISNIEYEWIDAELICIETTIINTDGVDGEPTSAPVMPVKCCQAALVD